MYLLYKKGCGSHKIEPSRGGCGLARVPIDPNKFEAKQSTGLASPALVPAAYIRRELSFALPLGYGLEPGSHGSQARKTPSGAGVALVLELYWVVGNPCINMVQSYRLVGPIYRHQLLCCDLGYQKYRTQRLRYQWSPNGMAA